MIARDIEKRYERKSKNVNIISFMHKKSIQSFIS